MKTNLINKLEFGTEAIYTKRLKILSSFRNHLFYTVILRRIQNIQSSPQLTKINFRLIEQRYFVKMAINIPYKILCNPFILEVDISCTQPKWLAVVNRVSIFWHLETVRPIEFSESSKWPHIYLKPCNKFQKIFWKNGLI